MSALPERKKSAEEIARMREQMGLPFVSPTPADSPAQEPVESEPAPVSPSKPVHPFKPSERESVKEGGSPEISPSGLPVRRRSAEELDELRRRESLRAISMETPAPVVHLQMMTAHWSLVALGYLLAIAAALDEKVLVWLEKVQSPLADFQAALSKDSTAQALGYLRAFGFSAGALLIALFIALRYPRSRHHAGFIAVIAGLVLVFDLLYYFPNLNPAHAP
jgi:hypothetical protein